MTPDNRFIYWKIEKPKASWNLIPDTAEAKKNAIKQGAMFFTWASLSEPYKGNGDPEPCRWGDLPLDFDSHDIGDALSHLRVLCIHFQEFYGIDPYEITYYLSGGKGFHAIIPAKLVGAESGDPQLPLIYKRMVSRWKEDLQLTTLDISLYNMKKGKMFRLPNVRRSNGKYKVPLSFDEVMRADAYELMEMGNEPRHFKDK